MKRHLFYLAVSVCLTSPLLAQEPYYPAYGYTPDAGYDTDDTTRQFNFNPGNMMNRMGNPMRGLFGSSNRRYEDYPSAGYAPPAYPPAYGYPATPGYQAPYSGYGYAPQAPATSGYPPASAPSNVQAEPAPQPASPSSPYGTTPPAAANYQPRFSNPDPAPQYQFRPLNAPKAAAPPVQSTPSPEPESAQARPEALPSTSVYQEPQPLAPLTYPHNAPAPEPLAPLIYPEAQTPPPTANADLPETAIPEDPNLKFRPLDKPGYSSELGQ